MTGGVLLTTGRVYSHSFDLDDLKRLTDFVTRHETSVTMAEVQWGATDPVFICVRHDVDHSIDHALQFAIYEHAQGITSSYYILPTAPYYAYKDEVRRSALAIQKLGHEVGIHNDSMSAALGNVDRALEVLVEWRKEFESWGIDVYGCADHGGAYPNTDIWRVHGHKPEEVGLDYEAYLLHQQGAHYISDNRGKLNGPLEDVDGKQTHILVHPVHWQLP
jgi:hypothetical protein